MMLPKNIYIKSLVIIVKAIQNSITPIEFLYISLQGNNAQIDRNMFVPRRDKWQKNR